MSRRSLPMLSVLLALGVAVPAHADSQVSATVPAGGSLRSSTDAAPSAATPVIVTITTRPSFKEDGSGCNVNCSSEQSAITIALKDKHDASYGPDIEGGNAYELIGPQIDLASSDKNNFQKIVFEVDRSLVRPDHKGLRQFYFSSGRSAHNSPTYFETKPDPNGNPGDTTLVERLPDGDFRLTIGDDNGFSSQRAGSFDLLQDAWYLFGYGMDEDLSNVLRKGFGAWMKTNYKAAETWKITVSPAVARALRLSSTVLGQKAFPKPGGGNRRIPFTAAARRALRKYSRVVVKVHLTARGPEGEVMRDERSFTLKKPESDLG